MHDLSEGVLEFSKKGYSFKLKLGLIENYKLKNNFYGE